MTEFLEKYEIIDEDRTRVAIQCYRGDDLFKFEKRKHFMNFMNKENTIQEMTMVYKGGAYNPVEALMGAGISGSFQS